MPRDASYFPELTTGCLKEMVSGVNVKRATVQILGSNLVTGNDGIERYKILISDGQNLYSFTFLGTELNHMAKAGKLCDFTIFRIDRFTCSMIVDGKASKLRVLSIQGVTLLNDGSDVQVKIGTPLPIPDLNSAEINTLISNLSLCLVGSEKLVEVAKLSTGCLMEIMSCRVSFENVEKPIVQILGSNLVTANDGNERYRLLLSDGKNLHSFVMLQPQLNDMKKSGKLCNFSIFRIDRFTCSMVRLNGGRMRVLIIEAVTVLNDGSYIQTKIGNPCPIPKLENYPYFFI